MKIRMFISAIFIIATLFITGCTLTTTLSVDEENYNVRLANNSGRQVKVRLDDGSYRYLDDGDVIYVPAQKGQHIIEIEDYSRTNTRPKQVFKLIIEADIDIVFKEDRNANTIIIEI